MKLIHEQVLPPKTGVAVTVRQGERNGTGSLAPSTTGW